MSAKDKRLDWSKSIPVSFILTQEVMNSVTPEAGAYVKALEATLGEVRSLPETKG